MARNSDLAYETLKSEILAGNFPAGHRLHESRLATTLGVSRTPIREALLRLDADGLVRVLPNRGAVVNHFADSELDELYELRALLEGYAAQRAAKGRGPETVERLRTLSEAMEAEWGGGKDPNFGEISRLNLEFHRTVQEAAGSQQLRSILSGVILVPLTQHTFSHYTLPEVRRSLAQHHELIDAIAAGDGGWAEAVMRSHILAARSSLQRFREDHARAAGNTR
jgi:DNA-binding GntR family transcriptional regulator